MSTESHGYHSVQDRGCPHCNGKRAHGRGQRDACRRFMNSARKEGGATNGKGGHGKRKQR